MLLKIFVLFSCFYVCNSIYVPGDGNTQSGSSVKGKLLGMKTLGWQGYDPQQSTTEQVQVFQNYTNVNVQQHRNDENLRRLYENNRNGRLQEVNAQTIDDEDTHGTTNIGYNSYGSVVSDVSGQYGGSSTTPCTINCQGNGNSGSQDRSDTRGNGNNGYNPHGVTIPSGNYPSYPTGNNQIGSNGYPCFSNCSTGGPTGGQNVNQGGYNQQHSWGTVQQVGPNGYPCFWNCSNGSTTPSNVFPNGGYNPYGSLEPQGNYQPGTQNTYGSQTGGYPNLESQGQQGQTCVSNCPPEQSRPTNRRRPQYNGYNPYVTPRPSPSYGNQGSQNVGCVTNCPQGGTTGQIGPTTYQNTYTSQNNGYNPYTTPRPYSNVGNQGPQGTPCISNCPPGEPTGQNRPAYPQSTYTGGYNPYVTPRPIGNYPISSPTPQHQVYNHYGQSQPTGNYPNLQGPQPCNSQYGCPPVTSTNSTVRITHYPHVTSLTIPQGQPSQRTNEGCTTNCNQPNQPSWSQTSGSNSYGGSTIQGLPFQPQRGHHVVHQQNVIVPQNYYSGKISHTTTNQIGDIQAYLKCPPGMTGHLPYEQSCNQFLNCWNGRGVVQNCAPGTLFNPATLECDYPGKVTCISGSRTARLIDASNLSEKVQANCPSGFSGIIPHYSDCTRFINCDNGRQHDMSCPPGTLFNLQINACDHAYKAICPGGQNERAKLRQHPQVGSLQIHNYDNSQYFQSQNQGQVQTRPQCPEGYSGVMAHPTECSKFLNCGHGRTHIMDCGPGTLFNPKLNVCDHPYNVECGQSPKTQQSSTTWSSSTSRYDQGQGTQFGGHPQSSFTGQTGGQTGGGNQQHQQNWSGSRWVQQQPQNVPEIQHNYYQQPTQQAWTHNRPNQFTHAPVQQNLDQQIEDLWSSLEPTTRKPSSNVEPLTASPSTYKAKQWPPPFPSTDVNADYVFEYEDLLLEPETEGSKPEVNWCDRKGFECGNKVCIAPTLVCNGEKDCPNGADEKDCGLSLGEFSKTAGTKLAVKEANKLENVTVAWCARSCLQMNCKSFNYRKNDGTCYILDSNVGSSGALIILPLYDYYENEKFFVDCSKNAGYLCTNKKCISKKQLCDGVNDCGDGMDEKGCTATAFNYKIRLVGGPNKHSGRIEVEAFGKVGHVCDDMFGLRNADVVCRELGFSLGAAEVRGNSYFAKDLPPANDTRYIMDDVSCVGNETTLRDCDFAGWGKHNCQAQEIVGVVCKTPVEACPTGHWQCANLLECLPLAFVCDGVYDCSDKSDEAPALCDVPTELRLTQGTKGRLELKHNGIWGTVCDDDFNDDAAKVVCRQLGHTGASKVVKDGQFGAGTGPIWLDQVFCLGNETELEQCIHWDWGEHNCEHTEDVGIICNDLGEPRHIKITERPPRDQGLPTKCGLRSDAIFSNTDLDDDLHFRVVHGSFAKPGEYPWQASIRVNGKTKSAHWCGAVVISSQYVLTAAHCLRGFSKDAYYVVAGDYDVDVPEGTEQEFSIEDFVIHPKFGMGNKMNNDLAVVRLKGRGFKLSKDLQPICLPKANEELPVGLNCTISGFGSIGNGKSRASKILRTGWIPILSKEVCKMPHVYGEAITSGMLCAGFMNSGVDACDGDSGGPLACLDEGVFKLYGVTSWGQHCGYANKPGVYVNVITYRDWIEEAMHKLSQ